MIKNYISPLFHRHLFKIITAAAVVMFIMIVNLGAGNKSYKAEVVFIANSSYLNEVVKSIEKAKSSILISIYMFKTTDYTNQDTKYIQKALTRAAEKGVKVTVLFDLEDEEGFLNDVNRETAEELEKNGVNIIYDSESVRTHTKLVVIDKRIVFIGSHNFTHSAMNYNNESSVKVTSQDFAEEVTNYIKGIER